MAEAEVAEVHKPAVRRMAAVAAEVHKPAVRRMAAVAAEVHKPAVVVRTQEAEVVRIQEDLRTQAVLAAGKVRTEAVQVQPAYHLLSGTHHRISWVHRQPEQVRMPTVIHGLVVAAAHIQAVAVAAAAHRPTAHQLGQWLRNRAVAESWAGVRRNFPSVSSTPGRIWN